MVSFLRKPQDDEDDEIFGGRLMIGRRNLAGINRKDDAIFEIQTRRTIRGPVDNWASASLTVLCPANVRWVTDKWSSVFLTDNDETIWLVN